jgi:hypothetical protein
MDKPNLCTARIIHFACALPIIWFRPDHNFHTKLSTTSSISLFLTLSTMSSPLANRQNHQISCSNYLGLGFRSKFQLTHFYQLLPSSPAPFGGPPSTLVMDALGPLAPAPLEDPPSMLVVGAPGPSAPAPPGGPPSTLVVGAPEPSAPAHPEGPLSTLVVDALGPSGLAHPDGPPSTLVVGASGPLALTPPGGPKVMF